MLIVPARARALARLPLPIRRRLLKMGWAAQIALGRVHGSFGIDDLLARSLRTGLSEARRIDRAMHFQDQLQKLEWAAAAVNSSERMIADTSGMQVGDAALFERVAATGEPVILAPIHMGNFAVGLAYVLHRFFPGRPVLVLRGRDDLPIWDHAMRRLGEVASDLMIVNVNRKEEFVDAMRFARRGAVTICFTDLPASYGSPADVTLFGEPARIALGLDSLARMVKGVVIPLACQSGLDRDRIVAGRPFEVLGSSVEERASIARLVAQQLERFIYAAPAQWHMWTRLHEYRLTDSSEGLTDELA